MPQFGLIREATKAFNIACLEQEGFGIVFLEAAACGVPQIAGNSGGAAEAVADGETGFVVDDPEDVQAVADAIEAVLDDGVPVLRRRGGGCAVLLDPGNLVVAAALPRLHTNFRLSAEGEVLVLESGPFVAFADRAIEDGSGGNGDGLRGGATRAA